MCFGISVFSSKNQGSMFYEKYAGDLFKNFLFLEPLFFEKLQREKIAAATLLVLPAVAVSHTRLIPL